jgi:predicted nucleic acid-binding protein
MAIYKVEINDLQINNNAMLLDTNVLVSAFYSKDPKHEDTKYFLEEADYQWLIPAVVVIETWGLLVGRSGSWMEGYQFLTWLNTPGKALVILPQRGDFSGEQIMVSRLEIDCVDAVLVSLAREITTQCKLRPSLFVATYDTRDFFKINQRESSRTNIYDMNFLQKITFD